MGKQINIQVWISSESWSGNADWKSPNSRGEVTGCTRSNIDRRVLLVKLCPFKTVVLELFSPGIGFVEDTFSTEKLWEKSWRERGWFQDD